MNTLFKTQIAEVDELKKENCSLQQSIKQVQELHKDTLALKEDIKKEIQKIYKNNANDQATLRNDIESVSDDFSSTKESLDMFEEGLDMFKDLMTKKVKFIRRSLQNKHQTWDCVYCNNVFENENKLTKHNEKYKVVCEECNVCLNYACLEK